MFTGIIRYTGTLRQIVSSGQGKRLTITADPALIAVLEPEITSVAINGSCHTVETVKNDTFVVYSSFESLARTNLGELRAGDRVNLELPVTPQSLLDGHIVQGHVDGVGQIESVTPRGEAVLYRFVSPPEIAEYLVEKDSIAIDGISLTIFQISASSFSVAVIPQTIGHTTLADKKPGSKINLEVNIFAKYARHWTHLDSQEERDLKIKKFLSE